MSEADDPGQLPKGQEAIDRRAWSRARQFRISLLGAVVLVILLLSLYVGRRLFGTHDAAVVEAPPPAGTFRATPQQMKTLTVQQVRLRGFASAELTEGKIAVDGDRTTPLFSPFSGRVTQVLAGLGDVVKSGAPLARIEAAEIVQGQSDLRTALAQVTIARISETRKHGLYDAKGGSLQDWQQAQADLAAAETGLNAARDRLRILGRTNPQIAELERQKSIVPLTNLAAPIAGVVVDRQVGVGQYLQAGSGTPVFTIADPTKVWLLANVRESDAGLVHVGQAVEVRVPAYPNRVFKANLTYVAAIVDSATHRLPVRAEIDNADGALKPEMFANFRILTSDATQSAAVPESAVVYEGAAAHVWVVAGDGLLSLRSIKTGRSDDGWVEVLAGVGSGEQVVTRGGLFIDQAAGGPSGS